MKKNGGINEKGYAWLVLSQEFMLPLGKDNNNFLAFPLNKMGAILVSQWSYQYF
jgi:hypothetical protein